MNIKTDNKPRPLLNISDIPEKFHKEFDYYNECALQEASFFKYKGSYHDLANFQRVESGELKDWSAIFSTSALTAILIRLDNHCDSVIVGTLYS